MSVGATDADRTLGTQEGDVKVPENVTIALALIAGLLRGDEEGVNELIADVPTMELIGALVGVATQWGIRAYGSERKLNLFLKFALQRMAEKEAGQ